MNKTYIYAERLCRLLSAFVLLFVGLFFLMHGDAIRVDTNLKSLSPNIFDAEHLQQAVDEVSENVEKRFTFVLRSTDIDEVEEASEAFREFAEKSEALFSEIDNFAALDGLKALWIDHRFQLAVPALASDVSDKKILERARQDAYGLSGAARLFSLVDDPFGYLSRVVFNSTFFSGDDDTPIEWTQDNVTTYLIPLHFSIADSAFNLDMQKRIEHHLHQLEQDVLSQYAGVSIMRSGVYFFARDAAKKSQRDISLISAGSSIGVVLLLLFVFRSFFPLMLPLISIAVGISFAFVACPIVFGAGLIGVVIDYALHYLYHYQDSRCNDSRLALLKALFFSLFTSIVGYAALALSDIQSLKHVALFSTLGLVAAWIVVIAMGQLFTSRGPQARAFSKSLLGLFNFFDAFKPVFWVFTLLLIAAFVVFIFIRGIVFSDNPRLFFTPEKQLIAEEAFVRQVTTSVEPGRYLVIRGAKVEDIYDRVEEISLSSTVDSSHLLGIHSLIPSPQQQKINYTQNARLYAEDGLAQAFLQELSVNDEIVDTIARDYDAARERVLLPQHLQSQLGSVVPPLWFTKNGNIYAFIMIAKGADTGGLDELSAINNDVTYINTVGMAERSIRDQRESAVFLIAVSIIFVSALLLVRYRRIRSLWLAAIPCASIALTLVIFQTFAIPISLFHVMALFLVLGLGMDYVIFVAEMSADRVKTFSAVFLSALTSLMSFGFLSISSLPVVSAFGLTVLIGNSLNFFGALVLSSQLNNLNLLDVLDSDE